MNRVAPDCVLADRWRAFQTRAFPPGATSLDGSRSLLDIQIGCLRYVDNWRLDLLQFWQAICYLVLGPFNFTFICINFATLPTWDPPSSLSPAAWGVVQLQVCSYTYCMTLSNHTSCENCISMPSSPLHAVYPGHSRVCSHDGLLGVHPVDNLEIPPAVRLPGGHTKAALQHSSDAARQVWACRTSLLQCTVAV